MKAKSYFSITGEGKLEKTKIINKRKNSLGIDINVLNVGFYLLTPILIGVFLGLFIDSKFHTQSYGVVGGILLGSVASFYNLFTIIQSNASHQH